MKIPRRIHFIGISGRAIGGVAIALHHSGLRVTGSDVYPYPPVSTLLAEAGVGYSAGFNADVALPKTVIVGSRIARGNVELEKALRQKCAVYSLPEFLSKFVLPRRRCLMVAGTNGKTTTAAMLTHILRRAGRQPGWLVGGYCREVPKSFCLGTDHSFVLEGDEYGASLLGDLNPKFLHYNPESLALINVAADHPDFFRHPDDARRAFAALHARVPPHGMIVVNADDPVALQLAQDLHSPVLRVGTGTQSEQQITSIQHHKTGARFRFLSTDFQLALHGEMNVTNAALAIALAVREGVPPALCAQALAEFRGVDERQSIALMTSDFAHVSDAVYHPAAVARLLESIGHRFPRRRIVVVFQPRITGSANWPAQHELPTALQAAAAVLLLPAVNPRCLDADPAFNLNKLAADLRRKGIEVRSMSTASIDRRKLLPLLRRKDVVVSCVQPSKRVQLTADINSVLASSTV